MVPTLQDPEGLFEGHAPKGFSYIHDGYFYLGGGKETEPKKQARYIFGQNYLNLTNTYVPKESYYSSDMHEYLGEYLRTLRDTYKLDLMGLYNCYSNRLISQVSLPMRRRKIESEDEDQVTEYTTWYEFGNPSNGYKITCFPIKFNTSYHIKIYGSINGAVTVQPIFYKNGNYLRLAYDSTALPITFPSKAFSYSNSLQYTLSLMEQAEALRKENAETLPGIGVEAIAKYLMENEKYLYLFVQAPQIQDLQISVVEEAKYLNVVNNTLLDLDVNYNVPFSDRLLEFLVDGVITPQDSIRQNITRVQTILLSDDFKTKFNEELFNNALYKPNEAIAVSDVQSRIRAVLTGHYLKLKGLSELTSEDEEGSAGMSNKIIANPGSHYYPEAGVYDETMRVLLYSLFADKGIPDFTGYVDKDVEQMLLSCVTSEALREALGEA